MSNIFRLLIFIITFIFLIGSNAIAGLNANTKYANPDMSLNFLTLYQNSNRNSQTSNGFSLQEAELQFFSDVDPYFRANALLSISQASPTSEFGVDPEEIFVETTDIPNVTFKIGKFKAALDRKNLMHTHALPFIDASLIDQQLVGDSLNEVGLSATLLFPASWFSELTIQALQGQNEILFNSPNRNVPVMLVHVRNLWDLSDDLTLDWGVTGSGGNNSYGGSTQLYASDLTFKWRSQIGGKYKSLIWSSEYLYANLQGDPAGEKVGGLSSWIQYQFAERWWIQGRFDYVGLPQQGNNPIQRKESALIGFFPSEFSGFRLQYDHLDDGQPVAENKISLQMNITIGAHPAHSY